ncbi:hypothetical protein XENTR_v10024997 [Xenopus tropicalis]|nr:hypothetical protein XENTR_v10024997 [Xenopus tropicalis]
MAPSLAGRVRSHVGAWAQLVVATGANGTNPSLVGHSSVQNGQLVSGTYGCKYLVASLPTLCPYQRPSQPMGLVLNKEIKAKGRGQFCINSAGGVTKGGKSAPNATLRGRFITM